MYHCMYWIDTWSERMNHIKIQRVMTPYEYEEDYWYIDGKILTDYLDECINESADEYLKNLGSFMGLCPAWSKELNHKGDVRFVWELIRRENTTIIPLLLCPDDLDFSCIVIVIEVDKTKDFVYWGRVGYVTHKNANFEEEKRSGILCVEAYSDEDWEKYGDNIALESTTSYLWKEWIGKNWDEELYRRRMNYTLPYYETEGNVCWFRDLNWCFVRDEYEAMVQEFWERTTLEHLQNILKQDNSRTMTIDECAHLFSELTFDGKAILQEHIDDYSEILLHILASDMVSEPLMDLLNRYDEKSLLIDCYISLIEIMWKLGDEAVRNVVDVTILERLSDDKSLWQKFGRFISMEFKQYINQEVLAFNAMMWGVKALE